MNENKPKLLLVGLNTTGGMGEVFFLLARGLSKRFQLHVITNSNISDDIGAQAMLKVHYSRKKPLSYFSLKSLHKIKRFAKESHADTVLVYTFHPTNLITWRFFKAMKRVVFIHDPFLHSGMPKLDGAIMRTQLRMWYSEADRILVASNLQKKELVKAQLCKSDRIGVAYLPLSLNDYKLAEELRCAVGSIDVLFFGRVEHYKGLDVLVEAASLMSGNPRIMIRGNRRLENIYPKLASSLPDCIEQLIGEELSTEELAALIAKSKVVVAPYRDATGTRVPLEAFACFRPVVGTAVGCMPEIIADGEDGIIVAPEDPEALAQALGLLLSDRDLRQRMGESGHKKLTLYSEDRVAAMVQKELKMMSEETSCGVSTAKRIG